MINLPLPKYQSTISIEEAIKKRRSIRNFKKTPLSLEDISQLLWATQGITNNRDFRTTPSAGATYPLEVFVVVAKNRVKTLEKGIYQYLLLSHSLLLHKEGEFEKDLALSCYDQSFIAEAPVNIVITAEFSRTTNYYGERGIRYVYIEVGHLGQNIYLQVISLNLATVTIGAFNDEKVTKILSLPHHFKPLYIMPIGYEK